MAEFDRKVKVTAMQNYHANDKREKVKASIAGKVLALHTANQLGPWQRGSDP